MSEGLPTRPTSRGEVTTARLRTLVAVYGERVMTHVLPERCSCVVGRGDDADFQIETSTLSRKHAVLEVDGDSVRVRDLGSSNGTTLNGTPVDEHSLSDPLRSHDVLELADVMLVLRDRGVATESSRFEDARKLASDIVTGGASLLLVGEAGVGKTTLARTLARAMGDPLLELDTATATAREYGQLVGFRDGTIILKGLDALRPQDQLDLRNALPRTGVRYIATSRNPLPQPGERRAGFDEILTKLVARNALVIPPLREDRRRIDQLCDGFVSECAARGTAIQLTAAARAALWAHPWTGNVPELRTVLESAVQRKTVSEPLTPEDLDLGPEYRDSMERERIETVLRECAGNQTRAAERLGVSRRTLVSRLDKYGIARPRKGRQAGEQD